MGLILLVFLVFIVPVTLAVVSYRNTITPEGIVIHHSALPNPNVKLIVDKDYLDAIHQRRGFGVFYWGSVYHIGYHYVILPDGTVQQGRPEHCKGAHSLGRNSYLGICLVGNFSTTDNPSGELDLPEPTPAQLSALVELCQRLCVAYQIPLDRVIRHEDVVSTTECPGDRFPFQDLQKKLSATVSEK